MNTKLLLLLGAVLGLLLVATLLPGTNRSEPDDPSQLIDSGHFVLELDGVPILEEVYTVEFHPADGYLLNSQGSVAAGGQTIKLAQQTQYDRNFLPINYHLAAETPSGPQIISAQMGMRGFNMDVRVGVSVQSAQVTELDNLALLDNNLIGQFAVMLMAIRTEKLDRSFTAAIPQALLSLPASVDGPNSVTFLSDDAAYHGKQFDLHLGDTIISLIEYEGHLAVIANRTQNTVGYDVKLFPSGVTIAVDEQVETQTNFVEHEITFASGDLTLAGTLLLPMSPDSQQMKAALLIQGSGPVDRDGNAEGMEMDAYRQIAHALADIGVASFRYDKRGVGTSEGEAALASRSDLVNDLRAALAVLRDQSQIDASTVVLIGHSEGAYLAPILAVEDPTIAGVVLLSGAARSLDEITRWQVETLVGQQGVEGDALDAVLAQQDQYSAFVKSSQGEWLDYTEAEIQAGIPWMTEQAATQLKASPLALSWLREHYLAASEETIASVTQPVLIISGEKDLQVPSTEAALLSDLLESSGNSDVTVHVLSDLNHLLRNHPEEPNLAYRHLNEPVDPRVIAAIQEWIAER